MEKVIIDDLPPPLHFQRTLDGIQIGHDLPIYPPISNDWYHGPTKTIDVCPLDWKEINLALKDEDSKIIKIGSQLTDKEIQQYNELMLEFIDVFAWSYTNLKGMPPKIVQHTIFLVSGCTSSTRKLENSVLHNLRRHTFEVSVRLLPTNRANVWCSKCGDNGHYASECYKRPQKQVHFVDPETGVYYTH